jgi:branched-chain amino acid transport system permease protein|tara:strand:+ start:85 stop:975 length:891 start_codon:yes stop_codon:yes gene_type:complete
MDPLFLLQIAVGGLLAGVMYSLVAIGFVLIYKSSKVFNFAQGSMVLGAALTFVSFIEMGVPFWLSLLITTLIMIGFGIAVERFALRKLANTSLLTLFMATVGLAFFVEGLAQFVWGGQVHGLELGIEDMPLSVASGFTVSQFDLFAAAVAGGLVIVLAFFFTNTRTGLHLRAVADNVLASLSVGIPITRMWMIAWATAGVIAIVAGLMWGARLGVQYTLSVVALKALPVFIMGGFTSISGAITAGLIVGAAEAVGELVLGPYLGWGTQIWIAYAVALIVVLIRPSGMFGQKEVQRI